MSGLQSNIDRRDAWFLGEDRLLRFTVLDDTNQPVDITGWTIAFKMDEREGGSNIITKPDGDGLEITDAANGVLDVTMDSGDTATLYPGTYWYTLERTDPGSVAVLAYGTAVLLAT